MVEADGESSRVVGGRYALGEVLGQGGMGVVRAAHDRVLKRTVAVKQLVAPPGLDQSDEHTLEARFLREARSAASLDHPSVVSVYDVVEDAEGPWIVMQLVKGRSLHAVVRDEGPLPVDRVAGIGLVLLSALDCAHGEGIVHRDLNPRNVLMADDGRVMLTDFGIAAALDATALTRTGQVVGTPGFIAPERAMGAQHGPFSDLWSLGVTLYTAVEGHSSHGEPPRRAGAMEPVLKGLTQRDTDERWTSRKVRAHLESVAGSAVTLPPTRRETDAPLGTDASRGTDASSEPDRNESIGGQEPPPSGVVRRITRRIARPVVLLPVIAVLVLALGVSLLMNVRRDGGSSDDKPTPPPKPAAVPDLCEPLGKNPKMSTWVPHTRKAPSATVPDGNQSSRTCEFVGKDGDDDYDLTVTVVGYPNGKTASSRLRSRADRSKAKENHTALGPEDVGSDSYFKYGGSEALILFRVGSYIAEVAYGNGVFSVVSPDHDGEEIAEWVHRQLEDASASRS